MDQTYMEVTDAHFENEEETQIWAMINGKPWSGIRSTSRLWPSVAKAIEDGLVPTPWAAAPEPTAEELLAKTDMELVKAAARMIEDIADERVTNGDYVSDTVKAKVAERKALRPQL